MAEANPYAGPRWLAYLMSAIAVVSLIAAALETPVGDWSTSNYLFGALLVLFAVAFAVAGARDSFNLVGRMSGKGALILGVIGTLASLIIGVSSVVGAQWNVDTILTTGTWIALFLMFAGSIGVARRKMQAGQ